MNCHICGREMRLVKSVIVDQSPVHQNTEETWRCDHCDGWRGRLRRANERAYAAIKKGRLMKR